MGISSQVGTVLPTQANEVGSPALLAPLEIVVPQADTTILPSDVQILVGSNESLTHLPRE